VPQPIIYDTDPGVDDAMALLFALCSPELDVLGVTTVYGNAEIELTTRNAQHVLEVAGRGDIPVARGAAGPLTRLYRGRRGHIHGEDGLGNIFAGEDLTGSLRGNLSGLSAPEFIARSVLARPGEITLVAVGPLTNLALALKLEPRIAQAVKHVVVMGGAVFVRGNASPVAEANFLNDPEAAQIVVGAGWPLTLVGLDVTTRTVMTEAYLRSLSHPLNPFNPLTEFIHRITPVYLNYYREHNGVDGLYTHDPSAVAYAIDPTLFTTRRVPLFVETEGRCAGQSVADPRHLWGALPEVEVCVDVDSERLLRLFAERLAAVAADG
jgi:uridine nucleosidase